MFKLFPLAATGTLLLAGVCHAQLYDPTYYTIDVNNDVLCSITVPGGVVTPLGPLGIDVDAVDLGWHQGALYMKTWGTSAGNKICQVVTEGHWLGAALQGQFLTGGGYQTGAEASGIASDGIQLHITYSDGSPTVQYSRLFGQINTIWAGVITADTVASPIPDDLDSLGFAGTQFYAIDVRGPSTGTGWDLYVGSYAGSTVTWARIPGGTYDVSSNPVDIEDYSVNDLIAVCQDGLHIRTVNRSNAAAGAPIAVTGLLPNGKLEGIAKKPAPCPRRIIWIP